MDCLIQKILLVLYAAFKALCQQPLPVTQSRRLDGRKGRNSLPWAGRPRLSPCPSVRPYETWSGASSASSTSTLL